MKIGVLVLCVGSLIPVWGDGLVIDHNNTDITALKQVDIERAKAVLHIGYGHTSHGSQLTSGMKGLVAFANDGGRGLQLPKDIFAWNNGGYGGALDLEEGTGYGGSGLGRDAGYWPGWFDETVAYLKNPDHADVNVLMWSWCGQMPGKFASGRLFDEYLLPMSRLETMFPKVVFVYMTGHVDIGNDANQKAACAAIREYCAKNNKVLYDFADIEHYNPDGTYFEFVSDNCDVFSGPNRTGPRGNWAVDWQQAHKQGVDWYACGSAHSQPLNANQKAYAAWALWCELAKNLDDYRGGQE